MCSLSALSGQKGIPKGISFGHAQRPSKTVEKPNRFFDSLKEVPHAIAAPLIYAASSVTTHLLRHGPKRYRSAASTKAVDPADQIAPPNRSHANRRQEGRDVNKGHLNGKTGREVLKAVNITSPEPCSTPLMEKYTQEHRKRQRHKP